MFDAILTVNTLYFCEQPQHYLDEMLRVLKPDGWLILTFVAKIFLEKVDAQRFGFKIYTMAEVEGLMHWAGFVNLSRRLNSEPVDGELEEAFYCNEGIKALMISELYRLLSNCYSTQ